jgi:bifunctional non-homologous end joining protein LigD
MEPILPMEPVGSDYIPQGPDWIAQVKWDGVRLLTYFDGKQVKLFNRNRNERTHHYPEVADIRPYCRAESVILDGEIIALGADGKPSFHEVMRRDGIRRMEKVAQVMKAVPVTYMIFDVIYKDGNWLDRESLQHRLEILAAMIEPKNHIQLVPSHADGRVLFEIIRQHGMEGIVMKKLQSPYVMGEKKDSWLKIKHYRDLIAAIGGYTLRGGIVNSVLLGLYDAEGKFWYVGHTGTGRLTHQEWRTLTQLLSPITLKERPFVNKPVRHADAYWVKPMFTVKIKYAEWTEGQSLRQPSIQAFLDLPPEQCTFSQR